MISIKNSKSGNVLSGILVVLLLIGLLIVGFYILNSYIYNEKQADDGQVQVDSSTEAERILVQIGQTVPALGVQITPLEVLEDSRCPANANCIQAGTVRVQTNIESGSGVASQVFELDKPITTEVEIITLISVDPVAQSDVSISENQYIFHFQVEKR